MLLNMVTSNVCRIKKIFFEKAQILIKLNFFFKTTKYPNYRMDLKGKKLLNKICP